MKTLATISAALLAVVLLAAPALAAEEIDSFWPACGAPGDPVMIKGSDFGDEPTVTFGDEEAKVLRSTATRILCRVPADLDEGDVTISVGDADATDDFTVLEEGAPVVYRLSVEKGAAGTPVFVYGRRLTGATVSFVDDTDTEQDSVEVKGGRRCAFFKVPEDLDEGTYTLVFENEDELDTGDCSPEFEVVEAGDAALSAADPEDPLPGRKLLLEGTDLAPAGPCKVTFTDADGETLYAFGFSNGYDEVRTNVPFKAVAGDTYDVVVVLRGDVETDALELTLGTYDDPELTELDPAEGPVGTKFAIKGTDLLVLGEKPVVAMDDGTDSTEVKILFAHPGPMGGDDVIVVLVPDDFAEGEYDVTVTVGDTTTDALTFEVTELVLAVDSMKPDSQGTKGPVFPVFIKGTGFGDKDSDLDLAVVWDDGTDTFFDGKVVFRSPTLLMVVPPGGWKDRLEEGSYTVTVTLDPDGDDEESVEAGTFTVE